MTDAVAAKPDVTGDRERTEEVPRKRARDLGLFYVLSIGLAWAVWIPRYLLDGPGILTFVGAWSPTVAAVAVAGLREGRAAVSTLLKSVLRARVRPRWYAVAGLGLPCLALAAAGLDTVAGGAGWSLAGMADRVAVLEIPSRAGTGLLSALPLLYLLHIVSGGPIAEELGWRGYAQPRLGRLVGHGNAGLLIGLGWSLWHLPLFVFAPATTGHIPFPFHVTMNAALGVLMAWLWVRTGGSTLLAVLFHGALNFGVSGQGLVAIGEDRGQLTIFVLLLALGALFAYRALADTPVVASATAPAGSSPTRPSRG